jgi:hypothetical protein
LGPDLSTGVASAVSHYIHRLESGTGPIGIPQFCAAHVARDSDVDVDLDLDEETRVPLQLEAERQGATVDRLAAHAVLVYLADLDRTLPIRSQRTESARSA